MSNSDKLASFDIVEHAYIDYNGSTLAVVPCNVVIETIGPRIIKKWRKAKKALTASWAEPDPFRPQDWPHHPGYREGALCITIKDTVDEGVGRFRHMADVRVVVPDEDGAVTNDLGKLALPMTEAEAVNDIAAEVHSALKLWEAKSPEVDNERRVELALSNGEAHWFSPDLLFRCLLEHTFSLSTGAIVENLVVSRRPHPIWKPPQSCVIAE